MSVPFSQIVVALLFVVSAANSNYTQHVKPGNFHRNSNVYVLNKYYHDIYKLYEKDHKSVKENPDSYHWLLPDAIKVFLHLFQSRETRGRLPSIDPQHRDRRSSSPFMTGVAFESITF